MNKEVKILLSRAISSNRLNNYSPNKCDNKVFGTIDFVSTPYKVIENRCDIPNNLKVDEDAIILILESPHIYEFDQITKEALSPANGKTGKNIKEFLPEILNNNFQLLSLQYKKYTIVVMNAVQYQCSLGEETELYRDAMFLYYWEQEKIRNNFIDNIQSVMDIYNTCVIINCCTKGYHTGLLTNHIGGIDETYLSELGVDVPISNYCKNKDYSLQNCVNTVLDKIISSNDKFYQISHPITWSDESYEKNLQCVFRGLKIKRNIRKRSRSVKII